MTAPAPATTTAKLTALLETQRAAFLRNDPPSCEKRMADLARLKQATLKRRREFESAVASDFGSRAPLDTAIMEIAPTVQGIDYLCRNLRKWMRPRRRHVALSAKPGRAYVLYQPLGVVGIISPWNFPIGLALTPLATALAAGNRALLKPSELTPATSALLKDMLGEIFPEDEVAVVTGGPEVGADFSALPFDHLFFTGSTHVGRLVMRAAADNLVPVTLELGGKSPAIVDAAFPVGRAAASIAYGKLANAGQICIAPDYALVQENAIDTFVAAFEHAVKKFYPKGSADPAYAAIINGQHFGRLQSLIDDARAKGARIVEIGDSTPSGRERILPPTLILGATGEMKAMQEEIFGPVLPIVAYKDADDAIARLSGARPLALYVFSENRSFIGKILSRTASGDVTVNDTLMHYVVDDLPFGGVGASGMGAYHGEEGFKTFSHARGVFEQSKMNFAGMVRPPFGLKTKAVLKYLLR